MADYKKSNVSSFGQSGVRFDYSGIFSVKEEYIFVFSGYSATGLLKSVEVFDTQREIWHVFGHESGFETEVRQTGTVCHKRHRCEAVSFSLGAHKVQD